MKAKMVTLIIGVICVLSITVWYRTWTSHDGDFAPVFAREVQRYGGRLATTNGLPTLRASWTIRSDANGFEFVVKKSDYDEVEATLFKMLGNDGQRYRKAGFPRSCLFKPSSIGVALIAVDNTNRTEITCLRAITNGLGLFDVMKHWPR